MLTLFSVPKSFRGHIGIIQENAIRSWMSMRPKPEILLFGDEEGTAKIADHLGLRHEPQLALNEFGTPLVDNLFEKAQRIATFDILCYINADILLLDDLLSAVNTVSSRFRRFLIVGQRWDVMVSTPIDFSTPSWRDRFRKLIVDGREPHDPSGIDYLIFPKGLWDHILPFAVGRIGWDNWMLYKARAKGAALVDVTRVITAIHQDHSYCHLPRGRRDIRGGVEARRNLALAGDERFFFTIGDANWVLSRGRLRRPRWTIRRLARELEIQTILFSPRLSTIFQLIKGCPIIRRRPSG